MRLICVALHCGGSKATAGARRGGASAQSMAGGECARAGRGWSSACLSRAQCGRVEATRARWRGGARARKEACSLRQRWCAAVV